MCVCVCVRVCVCSITNSVLNGVFLYFAHDPQRPSSGGGGGGGGGDSSTRRSPGYEGR